MSDDDLEPPAWVSRGGAHRADHRSASTGDDGRRRGRPARTVRRSERVRRRRRLVAVMAALALLGLPFVLALGWLWWQLDPPGAPGAAVTVEVRAGWGKERIGDELARAGVVGSSTVFQAYAALTGAGPFQPGEYEMQRDLGVRGAVDALEEGPALAYRELALPPGLTLDQIADRVAALPGKSRERFLEVAASGAVRSVFQPPGQTSLEGLTWPDTYYVTDDEDEAVVLARIVEEFDRRAGALGLAEAPSRTGWTPYETVVVASLIQTEAGVDEDRPLIAAVVRNRLADGIPLQIDATVLYARGGDRSAPITDADKAIPSPWNTYFTSGLPPTPISTVTAEALDAALAPADVPYRFYVLIDESGRHAFAVTFEEHERNVAIAREKGLL